MAAPTLIGHDMVRDEPVTLSLPSRLGGLYCLGKQGRGKTNFLEILIAQDLHAGRGIGVIDPHGDLTVDVLGMVPPHRENDVVLLDLQDTAHPFPFNFFAGVDPTDPGSLAMGQERIVGLFQKIWGDDSWGPRLADLLRNASLTLLCNPGTTLADLERLLTDDVYRQRLVTNVTSESVRRFWREYAGYTDKARLGIYAPLTNKVRAFLGHPLMEPIFSQDEGTVDIQGIVEQNKILLVRLDPQMEEATGLLGGAILLRILEAVLERKNVPESKRRASPFMLYCDEFQNMATDTFGKLLQQARKYGVATVLAHQLRSQLSSAVRDSVKGAVCIISFQLMTDDAGELSREYTVRRRDELPDDVWEWALTHSDETIRRAARELLTRVPSVSIAVPGGSGWDAPLSIRNKLRFLENRLRQAVKEGNPKATPFPANPYTYGTYDLQNEPYAGVADAFATLRDRLLTSQKIDASELAQLPKGTAAAKIERDDGTMRQYVLRFPLAIDPDHAHVVKTLFDHEGPLPETWPEELHPRYVEAGLRARRIRLRNRRRTAPAEAGATLYPPLPPAEATTTTLPLRNPAPSFLPIPQEADVDD